MTPPSRWRTGTLAVAGTIPVRSVNAAATLVRSQGHHPAGYRPAVPTRACGSGSDGGSRHAVPVRHPCPKPRPPPRAKGKPGTPRPPGRAHHRARRTRRQGRLRRRCASAPRPLTRAACSRDLAAIQDMRPDRHAPAPPPEPPRTGQTRHGLGAEPAKTSRAASYEICALPVFAFCYRESSSHSLNSPAPSESSRFEANEYTYAVTTCPYRVRPLCQFVRCDMSHWGQP